MYTGYDINFYPQNAYELTSVFVFHYSPSFPLVLRADSLALRARLRRRVLVVVLGL